MFVGYVYQDFYMSLLFTVILSTLLAGGAMALGATIACFEKIEKEWLEEELRHSVMAFGGGALLSAVALVLVPEGIAHLEPFAACVWFVVGGLSFMMLDVFLHKINTPASQLAAMLSDFIPESIALGAAFATGHSSAFLLAGLIALQNLPEGFSAYRELNATSAYKPQKIIIMFSLMALLGPIAGVSGYLWLSGYPDTIAAIMLFASGGILYSIFQDLAPQVKLEKHWAPPMGAVLGFVLGLFGLMITT
jgi:ZIP family zinc transporter